MNLNPDISTTRAETQEATAHETRLLDITRKLAIVSQASPEKTERLKAQFPSWRQETLEKAMESNGKLNHEPAVSARYQDLKADFLEHGQLLAAQNVNRSPEQEREQVARYYSQYTNEFLENFGARTEIDTALRDINRVQDRLFSDPKKSSEWPIFKEDYENFKETQSTRESWTPARLDLKATLHAVKDNKSSTEKEVNAIRTELALANSISRENLWQNVLNMEYRVHGDSPLYAKAGTMVEQERARRDYAVNVAENEDESSKLELKPHSAHQAAEATRGVRAKLSEYVPVHILPTTQAAAETDTVRRKR